MLLIRFIKFFFTNRCIILHYFKIELIIRNIKTCRFWKMLIQREKYWKNTIQGNLRRSTNFIWKKNQNKKFMLAIFPGSPRVNFKLLEKKTHFYKNLSLSIKAFLKFIPSIKISKIVKIALLRLGSLKGPRNRNLWFSQRLKEGSIKRNDFFKDFKKIVESVWYSKLHYRMLSISY